MSNQINTDSNLLSLTEMKGEEITDSPDSEELLIKTNNKGKIIESSEFDTKPPILNEKKSSTSLSFKLKTNNDNQFSYNVINKGKSPQKLYNEPNGSVISDIEPDQDNLSITTTAITDASDANNMKQHQSPTHSLRNKRFSYNSPSTSSGHPWNTASSSNLNNTASSSSNVAAATTNPSSSSNANANANNATTGSNSHRPSLASHTLSGSFVELLNLTNNALTQNSTNANNTNTNNNNNDNPTSPSSRHGSLSSNLQQNFIRLGLSDNINIETVEPSSTEEQRPSQVGPGETAWMLFRIYAVFKFLWSFVFSAIYFIHFVIKKSKSCDPRIYRFSIALTVVFAIQAISSLLLIIYLPTSITRYTNVVRRRVVISNRAWKITAYTVIAEVVMVIIGAFLIFDKDSQCSLNKDIAYIRITKVLIAIVISFYTLICIPFFILPCACTFKLLPEYKGISDKVLKRFNSFLYNPTEEVDEEDAPSCSICMENYKPGTRIKRLPCKHEFHPECITQWLETNNSCPICRQSFK